MMHNRARTPNTPFIPPLGSPEGSPAPVIPGQTTPNYSPNPGSAYLYPTSPYAGAPFIPPNLSPLTTPGVIPGVIPSTSQSRGPRQGLSEDFTGYPRGGHPFSSPNSQHHPQMTPMLGGYGQPPPGTPWHPPSAPPGYPTFSTTPWGPPPAPLPSPWSANGRGPPLAGGYSPYNSAFTPGFQPGPLPGAHTQPAWGMPPGMPPQGMPPQGMPPQQQGYFGGPPEWMQHPAMQQGGFFPPGPGIPSRPPPEPPTMANDRMPPFAQGPHYGPVLEPMLAFIVQAPIQLNPLIQTLPEDGSDQVHLVWNMLHPTSTIKRSSDPSHMSWSAGRDAPATFPRISAMNIISETIPWIFTIHAREKDRGVTCGEVIESIGHELAKFSSGTEFNSLSPQARHEVGMAYRHNRSRSPGVPGGKLGEGMKRLDFLGRHTMFAGIEGNDRVVQRLHGTVLPCTFVLKCSATMPMTKQEVKDQEARMRASSSQGHRSRANSTGARITVHPPSSTGDSDGDSADNDYDHHHHR